MVQGIWERDRESEREDKRKGAIRLKSGNQSERGEGRRKSNTKGVDLHSSLRLRAKQEQEEKLKRREVLLCVLHVTDSTVVQSSQRNSPWEPEPWPKATKECESLGRGKKGMRLGSKESKREREQEEEEDDPSNPIMPTHPPWPSRICSSSSSMSIIRSSENENEGDQTMGESHTLTHPHTHIDTDSHSQTDSQPDRQPASQSEWVRGRSWASKGMGSWPRGSHHPALFIPHPSLWLSNHLLGEILCNHTVSLVVQAQRHSSTWMSMVPWEAKGERVGESGRERERERSHILVQHNISVFFYT